MFHFLEPSMVSAFMICLYKQTQEICSVSNIILFLPCLTCFYIHFETSFFNLCHKQFCFLPNNDDIYCIFYFINFYLLFLYARGCWKVFCQTSLSDYASKQNFSTLLYLMFPKRMLNNCIMKLFIIDNYEKENLCKWCQKIL